MKKAILGLILMTVSSTIFASSAITLCSVKCLEISQVSNRKSIRSISEIGRTKQEAKDKIYGKCSSNESFQNSIISSESINENGTIEYNIAEVIQDSQCSSVVID